MNTDQTPTEFMVLFRSTDWHQDLSLDEMQQVMDRTYAWFDRLRQEGKFKAAQPLFNEGKVISGKSRRMITDGPFAESKESVGGYLILNVATMEEALAIAKEWPLLDCGSTLEVRPIAPECPDFHRLRTRMAKAAS
ncbi:MAG: hypothetical protein EA425_16230 [Puniceicoccaceae bacterium]|nr:MAG: hypothetical protein EA425_16230 [Puniceicoccaceae bacterium]